MLIAVGIFAEVIYVKKKGDGGPPPEKGSAPASVSSETEYQLPSDNNNGSANGKESHKKNYIYSGDKNSNLVALTFDDGPNAKYTPMLISILKEKNVKATFFLLGEQVKLFPAQAKALADEGHEVACHSLSHKDLRKASKDEIVKEICDAQEIIEQATGKKPKVFRPPYGNSNATVVDVCKSAGIDNIIFWSVDTNDWKPGTTKADIVAKTTKEARGGAIILLHDRFTKSVEAAGDIIDELKAKGYKFVTVSEMLNAPASPSVKDGANSKPGLAKPTPASPSKSK